MPRRSSARTTTTVGENAHQSSPDLPSSPPLPQNVANLRTQWKWAAFSQFFFTFSHLFAMNDVALADIEDDLVHGSNIVLPRIMQRLLYTLSYDRKISLDNWQTALRKQYRKRDSQANPIGPEPVNDFYDSRSRSVAQDLSPNPEAKREANGNAETKDQDPQGSIPKAMSPGDTRRSTSELGDIKHYHPEDHSEPQESVLGGSRETPEGMEEEPRDWLDLPMLDKLDSMYLLTEWQFQNPTRVRTLMRNDDETASWRIEPIGYDSKRNAYWLIGDRLWIQRVPPPRARNLKRKRTMDAKPSAAASKPKQPMPKKRPRHNDRKTQSNSTSTGRQSRAAKAQANQKLDAQAKELAEYNRQTIQTRNFREPHIVASLNRPLGTRVSARLRGAQDEGWQPVPTEWLEEAANGTSGRHEKVTEKANSIPKTGLESDDESVSDLTELSDESDESGLAIDSEPPPNSNQNGDGVGLESIALGHDTDLAEASAPLPVGFVEWETICVTLHEWEHIADRFEKATHYAEKALYKFLVNNVIPDVTEELRGIHRKKQLEEAVVHRKRSSRIAIKESEKEEARAIAKKKADEAEKMSRARRLEARLQKEEADRIRRETAREQRRKEREEKEAFQKQELDDRPAMQVSDTVNESERREYHHVPMPFQNGNTQINEFPVRRPGSGSHTPIGGDWELDCEVCQRHGINIDDGTPMMCCGSCSKWQHIVCHDRADHQAGNPRRNWDIVEFICRKCRLKRQPKNLEGYHQQHQTERTPHQPPQRYHSYQSQQSHAGNATYGSLVNDNASYPEQLSDIRSAVVSGHPRQQAHAQHSYPPHVAFNHYQPGFATNLQPYSNPTHTQPYGQQHASSQFSQYADLSQNGHSVQSYQQRPVPPQARWNATGNTQTLERGLPYDQNASTSSRPSNSGHYRQNVELQPLAQLAIPDSRWQPYQQASTTSESPHGQFPATQFRYHPTSYQSPS